MNALIPMALMNHSKKYANQEAILFYFFESTLFMKLTTRYKGLLKRLIKIYKQ